MERSGWLWIACVALAACGSDAGAPGAGASSAPVDDGRSGNGEAAPAANGATPPSAFTPPAVPKLGAPYPIVLLHGMAGFGKLQLGPVGVAYFDDVRDDFARRGEQIYVTLAPPYATSEARAQVIAKQIDEILARTNRAKVNLVGHSQGGLDARVLASPNGLGYGDRVASITTIATPHHGTRVADATMGLLSLLPATELDAVANGFLSLLQKSVYELESDPDLRAQVSEISEEHMRQVFNPKYVDDPRVVYRSYAGRTNLRTGVLACRGSTFPNEPTKLDAVAPELAPTSMFLEEGLSLKVNDGLVTVESARWGRFEQCVPADHAEEVGNFGVPATFDHLKLFRDVAARLRDGGL